MLVGLIRALLRPPRRRQSNPSRSRLPPKYVPVERRRPSSRRAGDAKNAPFDPTTAKPQAKKQIIVGRAYIVDGDTIKIRRTQIRLFGIDAPEMNHPYGRAAKNALFEMCVDQTVHAEILETDNHGRTVAICRLDDGRDLSAEMVKLGLAIDWPKFSGGAYQQLETSDARKKLWLADARQKGRMYLWYRYDLENRRQLAVDEVPSSEVNADLAFDSKLNCLCPKCGEEMVERPNRRTGVKFWGCPKFPKCRGSRSMT